MSLPLYRIRESKRAKRLALRLDPIERVFDLVVPKRCSLTQAIDFADTHEQWMEARIRDMPPLIKFEDGAAIPLNGKDVMIAIHILPERKTTKITLEHDDLIVITNQPDPTIRITRWLKTYSKNLLTEKSEKKALKIGKIINNVSVRDTKSRWGSCSIDGNLSYSWRLIFAPPAALDYVVAHEVAHLQHHDHSKAFWNLCRDLSDNFLEGQYWMKAHGSELMRYG